MKSLALAGLMMLTIACVPRAREQPRVPTSPVHPSAPKLKFNALRAPAAPHISAATGVVNSAFPKAFPIEKNELVVVTVPSDSVVFPGSELETREAFLSGFLQSNFRVKDAGYLTPTNFDVPSTAKNGEQGVVEANGPPNESEQQKSHPDQAKGDAQKIGSPRLNDPTSIWALKLLKKESLNASYLFRVFSFVSSEKTSKNVPTSLNEARYERYLAAVQSYNDFLKQNERLIEEYRIATNNYRRARDKYHADYREYEASYAKYEQALKRHNARTEDKSPAVAQAPRAPIEEPTRIPRPVTPLTQEQILNLGLNEPIRVNVIHFLAALIDAASGEVIWTGDVEATGALDHRELVVRAIAEMTASSESTPQETEPDPETSPLKYPRAARLKSAPGN
jgi:hypothetical protein